MKIKSLFLLFCIVCLLSTSCDDGIDDSTLDCIKEEAFVAITHTFNPDDRKTVNLFIDYTGDKTITSIMWDFGDGINETDTGLTTIHTYTDTGLYVVKADVNIIKGVSACTLKPYRRIIIK